MLQELLCSVHVYLVFCAYHAHFQLMPEVNSVWDPVAGESIVSSTVDVSVAVATPNGLITPIVSSANQRTIPEIAAVLKVSRGGEQSRVWLRCGHIETL